jgi:hypothetical protein
MLYSLYVVSAQNQPPLVPPQVIWGTATYGNNVLTSADTQAVISVKMPRLLVIFLDSFESQTAIGNIITELNAGATTTLSQQFLNSAYCQSRGLVLTSPSVTKINANEWQVRSGKDTYTVWSQQVSVWNGSNWVNGNKLEVYWHNGLLVSYKMGDIATNNYVLEIPIYPANIAWGNNTYELRDPGKVKIGDNVNIYINGARVTTPPMPYNVTADPFVQMNIKSPSEITWELNLPTGWSFISYGITKCFYQGDAPDVPDWVEKENVGNLKEWFKSVMTPTEGWKMVIGQDYTMDIALPDDANSLNYMSPHEGYWVLIDKNKAPAGATLTLTGKPVDPGTNVLHLQKDWNMVGYPSLLGFYDTDDKPGWRIPTVNEVPTDWQKITGIPAAQYVFGSIWNKVIIIFSEEHTFDPTLPLDANSLRFVAPGQGFWVKVSQACDLQYPSQ